MTEHIQECPSSNSCDCNMGPVHKDSCPQRKKCICPALRACEQRVRQDERAKAAFSANVREAAEGWANGVQAARDAVAAQQSEFTAQGDLVGRDVMQYALAAIDALNYSGNRTNEGDQGNTFPSNF